MTDKQPEYNPGNMFPDIVDHIGISSNCPTPTEGECFQAKILRAALDIPSTSLPEDLEAVQFDGYTCPFVRNDGKECTFADPMVFLQHGVGFVAMGSKNFCRLELDSPRDFKRASIGSMGVRAVRFARQLSAVIKQKFAE